MRTAILSSLVFLGLSAGCATAALAQDVYLVKPGQTETEAQQTGSVVDPLNYFAASAEERKRMEEQKAAMPEGSVPASELEYLPEELEVGGSKATLKIEGGRIVSGGSVQPANYDTCEAYRARGETEPDGCIQKLGAEKTTGASAYVAPSAGVATTPIAGEQPKTLDQQLEEKGGANASDAVPTVVNTPDVSSSNAETNATAPANTPAPAAGNVENTAVVDKQRGSKTNIISNTDTGVQLSE